MSEMAGHQGVYARLRRAMPGHDGESSYALPSASASQSALCERQR